MTSRKVLIDTNICIDAIQKRKPFDVSAQKILDLSERGIIKGFVSAHSFDTIFYILIQLYPKKSVYQAVEGLRKTVSVANVSEKEIDNAINLKWPDFEDAIHYQAAVNVGCEAIVTRNQNDFQDASLQVISPQELLMDIGDEE